MSVFKYKVLAFVFYAAYVVGIGQSLDEYNCLDKKDGVKCGTTDGMECLSEVCVPNNFLELCKATSSNLDRVKHGLCDVYCEHEPISFFVTLPDHSSCSKKMECISGECGNFLELKTCETLLPNATNVRLLSQCSFECYNENGGSVKSVLENETKCGDPDFKKVCYKGQCASPDAIQKCSSAKKDYRIVNSNVGCKIFCYDKDNNEQQFLAAKGKRCDKATDGICDREICFPGY